MLEFESQFDCILIGTGNSGKATVEALREKGKKAYYIELKPEMIATLISQHAVQQSAETGDPSSQTETHIIRQEDGDIILSKQTLHTENLETNTYTLQVKKQAKSEQVTEQDEISFDMGSFYQESSHEQPGPNENGLEIIEAQQVEYAKPPFSFFGERTPFRKKSLRRKHKLSYQEHAEPDEEYPIYQLERIHLEDEEDSNFNPENDWNSTFSGNKIFPDEEEKETSQEPVYRERERKLRKKLSGKTKRLQVIDPDPDESPVNHKISHSSSTVDDPSQDDLLKSYPDFYPNDFEPKADYPEPEADLQNYSYHSLYEQTPENRQQNELVPLEPFSPRRRIRSSKKTRFKQRRESLVEKVTRQIKEKNRQQSGYSLFPDEPSGENNQNPLFPNGQPSMQPFSHETNNTKKNNYPLKKTEHDDPETGLKRDDIELEDAYGGYSSWEEIMTPYSQNNRKRQEIDKIEKRKIALRGLHNLINNLG
ncbi:hypothetical protein [Thermoactinomyces mirandus]|uniref:Uncharacterized protein n=1 Tax=Thermoactinomyces mirandus TaxID=2756294 RepID=A0A7W2ARD3_9BACL|nr:hypothetical protein [Thermoactinomyces mirandus]MBA4602869.1 hypothetical protein [Thermoactinomyces mirandus]